jgi:hypothetical protein
MRPHGGQGGGAGSPCEQIVEEEPDPSSAVVGETEKSKLDATAGADEVGSLHMTPSVDVPSDAPRVCALALSVDAQLNASTVPSGNKLAVSCEENDFPFFSPEDFADFVIQRKADSDNKTAHKSFYRSGADGPWDHKLVRMVACHHLYKMHEDAHAATADSDC